MLDPRVFDPAAVDAETRALNQEIVTRFASQPDPWTFTIAQLRERRAKGQGALPVSPKSSRATTICISRPSGEISLRIIAPEKPRSVYFHIHGGGWHLGAADQQDAMFERFADRAAIACVSVDYRLAPEHPWPAAATDCETAARWLVREAKSRFGTERLFIGGESAGAHLSVVTLLRLRDRHGLAPFAGANLVSGIYDLSLTPSVRRWGPERLVHNTRDIENFVGGFLQGRIQASSSECSPLQADLRRLPRTLLTVGTRDPLLDNSLFLASRLACAGANAELAVYPGGCHVFTAFPTKLADKALTRIEAFLGGV